MPQNTVCTGLEELLEQACSSTRGFSLSSTYF